MPSICSFGKSPEACVTMTWTGTSYAVAPPSASDASMPLSVGARRPPAKMPLPEPAVLTPIRAAKLGSRSTSAPVSTIKFAGVPLATMRTTGSGSAVRNGTCVSLPSSVVRRAASARRRATSPRSRATRSAWAPAVATGSKRASAALSLFSYNRIAPRSISASRSPGCARR